MARIRSDKPEAYQSETLAEITLAAERTFKGMATIADDRGRLADKPAQINGELWSMRGSHTKDDLDAELDEMVKVDLVCRYTGCDGKRYLHLVRWDQHQKIDRPSKSRLPRCPHHRNALDSCGLHEGECISREMPGDPRVPSPDPREDSMHPRETSRDLQQVETGQEGGEGALATPDAAPSPDDAKADGQPDGRTSADQGKRKSSRGSRESSMQDLGSRTVDRGSKKPAAPPGTADPLPDMPGDPPESVGQRINRLARFFADLRPMSNFNAVQTVIHKAVKADYADDAIEGGLKKVAAAGLALTTETLRQAIDGPPKRGHQPYRNPEDDSIYEEPI
jgi:hypothetical protein